MNVVFLILAVGAGCTFLAGVIQGLVAWYSTDPLLQRKLRPFIIGCVILTIAFVGASYYSLPSTQGTTATSSTSTPTVASSTPTSSTTATAVIQPSATVSSGLIKKNIMLTCHTCTSDPILATLNSIQIDNANGRMIWDITLKNVASGPNYQYKITKYDLQTSNSLTPISGTSSQQDGYFSGSVPDDVQVVFTTIPLHNVTYTFTLVVNQNFYAGTTVPFDPIDITF